MSLKTTSAFKFLALFAALASAAPNATVQWGETTVTGTLANGVEFYGGTSRSDLPSFHF